MFFCKRPEVSEKLRNAGVQKWWGTAAGERKESRGFLLTNENIHATPKANLFWA